MAEDHLDLFEFEIGRIQSGEFFLGVRCPWYEGGHVEQRVGR